MFDGILIFGAVIVLILFGVGFYEYLIETKEDLKIWDRWHHRHLFRVNKKL